MSDFKDLSALKARTDREMVAFLSAFLLDEMDRRWFLATKLEGEDLRSWSERVASEMRPRIAMIIDVSAGQMSERIARWWHDVRIRRVSVRMLDEGDPTPVVRVSGAGSPS